MLRTFRDRPAFRVTDNYEPIRVDQLRRLATYSANLVMLRLAFQEAGDRVLLDEFTREGRETSQEWRAILNLWRSGLDVDGWLAMIGSLENFSGTLSLSDEKSSVGHSSADYHHARLAGDRESAARLRYGMALNDGIFLRDDNDPLRGFLAELYADLAGLEGLAVLRTLDGAEVVAYAPRDGYSESLREAVRQGLREPESDLLIAAVERLLLTRQANFNFAGQLIHIVRDLDAFDQINPLVLLVNVCRLPKLLEVFPELQDASYYADADAALLLAHCVPAVTSGQESYESPLLRELVTSIARLTEGSEQPTFGLLPEKALRAIERFILTLRDDGLDPESPRGLRRQISFMEPDPRRQNAHLQSAEDTPEGSDPAEAL